MIASTLKKNTKWLIYLSTATVAALLVFVGIQSKNDGAKLLQGDEANNILGERAFADHSGSESTQSFNSGDDDDGGDNG